MNDRQENASIEAIAEAIERAGSPTQLAAEVGCRERQVYRWRSGAQVISPQNARLVAEATGVGVEQLRGDIWPEE